MKGSEEASEDTQPRKGEHEDGVRFKNCLPYLKIGIFLVTDSYMKSQDNN
jgi:hypothetical protein